MIGNVIHCRNYKSRLTKENKMVDVILRYETGLDRYYGLIDLAVEHEIFNKVSTRIELPCGTKKYAKEILKDPERYFTKEILDKIDDACQKEFLYGSAMKEDENVDSGTGE